MFVYVSFNEPITCHTLLTCYNDNTLRLQTIALESNYRTVHVFIERELPILACPPELKLIQRL